MLKDSRFPSHYYPGYFKMDLNLGLDSVSPLATALDEAFYEMSERFFENTWKIQPDVLNSINQVNLLKGYGFKCDHLNPKQILNFYKSLSELFTHRGALNSLEILSKIYFGDCEVRRGRPYPRQSFASGTDSFQLAEKKDLDHVVFIRLPDASKPEKIEEFKFNAKTLIPTQFEIEVAVAVKAQPHVHRGYDLNSAQVLKESRL